MAPQLTEDEIEDLIYLARVGEDDVLSEDLTVLADRSQLSVAEILTSAKNDSGSTALHMAAGNGHSDTVRNILECFETRPKEEKQAFIDSSNDHGNTSLHWAALGGHLKTVQLLMEHGASPALANESNYVPLDLAQQNDHAKIVQYFFSCIKEEQAAEAEGK